MVVQGKNRATLNKERKKVFHHYPTIFQKFGKPLKEIYISIMESA